MYSEITIALLRISIVAKDQIGLLSNPSKCIKCTFDIISHRRTRKPIPPVLKALTRDNSFFRVNVRCCCVKPFRIRVYYFIFKATKQHEYVWCKRFHLRNLHWGTCDLKCVVYEGTFQGSVWPLPAFWTKLKSRKFQGKLYGPLCTVIHHFIGIFPVEDNRLRLSIIRNKSKWFLPVLLQTPLELAKFLNWTKLNYTSAGLGWNAIGFYRIYKSIQLIQCEI